MPKRKRNYAQEFEDAVGAHDLDKACCALVGEIQNLWLRQLRMDPTEWREAVAEWARMLN